MHMKNLTLICRPRPRKLMIEKKKNNNPQGSSSGVSPGLSDTQDSKPAVNPLVPETRPQKQARAVPVLNHSFTLNRNQIINKKKTQIKK